MPAVHFALLVLVVLPFAAANAFCGMVRDLPFLPALIYLPLSCRTYRYHHAPVHEWVPQQY